MSENSQHLKKKMASADQLGHVVRTMKMLSAANVTEFERAAKASAGYYNNVERGLSASLRKEAGASAVALVAAVGVVIFGSDQGLVGQFNESLCTEMVRQVASLGKIPKVWVVGDRMSTTVQGQGIVPQGVFGVPTSVTDIAPIVGKILLDVDAARTLGDIGPLIVFHNRPREAASYEVASRRLLPFDTAWRHELESLPWPTAVLPEVIDPDGKTLSELVLEYLFVALFRACAESLASENISRLVAMQAAEKNIRETVEGLTRSYHRTRQAAIDEELFDVVSSFEAMNKVG